MKTPANFETVATIAAHRDRAYKPHLFRKGDPLSVGITPSATGHWLVHVYNREGERAESLYNKAYKSKQYARSKAREFATYLGE